MRVQLRLDFDPSHEVTDTIEEVDWFTAEDTYWACGQTRMELTVMYAYVHPESVCAWIICKSKDGGLFEINFDNYDECGIFREVPHDD